MSRALCNLGLGVLHEIAAAVPGGVALLGFIDEHVDRFAQESQRITLESVFRRLVRLEGRTRSLAEQSVELRKELSETVTQAAIIARRSHAQIKLQAAARLMTNCLLGEADPDRLERSERQLFLNAVESVSDVSLELLARLDIRLTRDERENLCSRSARRSFSDLKRLVSVDESLLMGIVGELGRFNLLHRAGDPVVRTGL